MIEKKWMIEKNIYPLQTIVFETPNNKIIEKGNPI
jgi:hypothetical protein